MTAITITAITTTVAIHMPAIAPAPRFWLGVGVGENVGEAGVAPGRTFHVPAHVSAYVSAGLEAMVVLPDSKL